ncbi:hypothetical protein HCD_08315 [Helicobacter cetorum MIT 99-5656]|uniref:Toprim domain-containing protein n=1 Tax=Helicobacter cetorum (strain ATCC BAA-540 / CCUG 52418 / MIT 99-5656) TaxID=1163745 RepID=I0EUM6_HELCM|nr:hypothetical protein HCD_08315 [Helicobacter cetorum MIT 99-5656]
MSYIPNLTALPLHEILLDNGYVYNKDKTSKNNPVLKHENEEGNLVIFKNKNENGSISYTYKDTHTDKVGNIITFCKDRNISVEDLLAGKLEDYRNKKDTLQARDNAQENNKEVQKIREEFKNLKPYDLNNATLIKKRGIDVKLLEPYKDHLKTDNFNNLILATYLAFEDKKLNVIPIQQCGVNKRLNTPLATDKEGNIRDKPLKSIAQGNKGIEVLMPKDFSLVKNVILTENIFDSLAYLELQNLEPKESILISTAGQFNAQKLELFFQSFFKQLHNRQQGVYNNYLRQEQKWQELVKLGKASDDFNSVVVETYTDIIKNYQKEKNMPIYNKQVEKTREFRKPKPISKPQESFNVILAFDNDIKGKGYKEKCEGILYAITQQFPTIYTPFSKDCNDDLKLAHIIGNKEVHLKSVSAFIKNALTDLQSQEKAQTALEILETIHSLKPFKSTFKQSLNEPSKALDLLNHTSIFIENKHDEIIDTFNILKPLENNHPYFNNLDADLLENYKHSFKLDENKEVCVALFNAKGNKTAMQEISALNHSKDIKNISVLKNPTTKLDHIKQIIIANDPTNALSFMQLHRELDPKNSLVVSVFQSDFLETTKPFLDLLLQDVSKDTKIILSTNNEFSIPLTKYALNVTRKPPTIHTPFSQSFSNDLRLSKLLNTKTLNEESFKTAINAKIGILQKPCNSAFKQQTLNTLNQIDRLIALPFNFKKQLVAFNENLNNKQNRHAI